jgi:hypothetical protein
MTCHRTILDGPDAVAVFSPVSLNAYVFDPKCFDAKLGVGLRECELLNHGRFVWIM